MDTDRIAGAAKELGGKAQSAVGNLAGDKKTEIEGRLNEVAGKGQNILGQAKDAVSNVASSASDIAQDAYNNPGRYVDHAQDALRSAAGSATDLAQDAYNDPGRYLRQGGDVLQQQVEENPLVALLVAGAVGYGLALLIHGRR